MFYENLKAILPRARKETKPKIDAMLRLKRAGIKAGQLSGERDRHVYSVLILLEGVQIGVFYQDARVTLARYKVIEWDAIRNEEIDPLEKAFYDLSAEIEGIKKGLRDAGKL